MDTGRAMKAEQRVARLVRLERITRITYYILDEFCARHDMSISDVAATLGILARAYDEAKGEK